jgi:hypothetical protein
LDKHERAFEDASIALDEVSARRRSAEERVAGRARELAVLSEACMSTAMEVEDVAGGSASGAGEVTRLKDTMRGMSREMADMEVRMAVARERLEGKRLSRRRAALPPLSSAADAAASRSRRTQHATDRGGGTVSEEDEG